MGERELGLSDTMFGIGEETSCKQSPVRMMQDQGEPPGQPDLLSKRSSRTVLAAPARSYRAPLFPVWPAEPLQM